MIILLRNAVARNPQIRFNRPINFTLAPGEHLAIVGPNGSGKTILVDTITGKHPLCEGTLEYDFSPSPTTTAYDNIKYITFRDSYGPADANYYYQQRWNAHDQDDIPTVGQLLGSVSDHKAARELFALFNLSVLLPKKIIHLSSGELRKFQLAKALLGAPRVLIIDNPFIGLDAHTRHALQSLLGTLARGEGLQIILVLSAFDDIPGFITHIVPVVDRVCAPRLPVTHYRPSTYISLDNDLLARKQEQILCLPPSPVETISSREVVKLTNVSIRYGERTILKDLNWCVGRGEKWALKGNNGSGKSTLLSLVCADNPQSYACQIALFGRRRGTGESIWDIKKHIGYVSPEMHRAYLKNIPAIEIVASGLHDSIGLYKRPRPEQLEICRWWMNIFDIDHACETPFLQLSSGEQRLVLLARAFVKDPLLLILDEPLHGLDTNRRRLVKAVIEAFCRRLDKTVIMVTHYEEELPDCIDRRLELTGSY